MKASIKKHLILAVKLIIAAGLLWLIFSKVHWNNYVVVKGTGKTLIALRQSDEGVVVDTHQDDSLPETIAFDLLESTTGTDGEHQYIYPGFKTSLLSIDRGFALAGVGVFVASMLVLAFRWRYVLSIQDVHITVWVAIRLSFLGFFFNNVIPGTVGGDVFKAWHVGKQTGHKAGAFLSVLVDRGLGSLGLCTTATVMLVITLLTGLESFSRLRVAATSIICIFSALIVIGVFLFSPKLRKLCRIQKLYAKLPIAHHFEAAGQAAMAYQNHPGKLVVALCIAASGHLCFIMAFMLLGMGLGIPTPWFSYFLYIPMIYVIGSAPVTPGGIGLIEGLFVTFFAVGAAGASGVLVLALFGRLLPILLSLPGLGVFLMGPKTPDAETVRQEMENAVDD